jgi:glutamyl-tRNA reductase
MPPKERPTLINQHHILVPTTTINNNDGSAHSAKLNKVKTKTNSKNKDTIVLIGAGVIVIIYLMCKK